MIKRWTPEEIAKLKSMAQKYPAAKIAEELGRGFPATRVKAHQLGLSLRLMNERRGVFKSDRRGKEKFRR
jgi:signal transduction histidine kinase